MQSPGFNSFKPENGRNYGSDAALNKGISQMLNQMSNYSNGYHCEPNLLGRMKNSTPSFRSPVDRHVRPASQIPVMQFLFDVDLVNPNPSKGFSQSYSNTQFVNLPIEAQRGLYPPQGTPYLYRDPQFCHLNEMATQTPMPITDSQAGNFLAVYKNSVDGRPMNYMDAVECSTYNQLSRKNISPTKKPYKLNPLAKEYIPKTMRNFHTNDSKPQEAGLQETVPPAVPPTMSEYGFISESYCNPLEGSSPSVSSLNEPSVSAIDTESKSTCNPEVTEDLSAIEAVEQHDVPSLIDSSAEEGDAMTRGQEAGSGVVCSVTEHEDASGSEEDESSPSDIDSEDEVAGTSSSPAPDSNSEDDDEDNDSDCDDYDAEGDDKSDDGITFEADTTDDGEICFTEDDCSTDCLGSYNEVSNSKSYSSKSQTEESSESDSEKAKATKIGIESGRGLDLVSYILSPASNSNAEDDDSDSDNDYDCDFFSINSEDESLYFPVGLTISEVLPRHHTGGDQEEEIDDVDSRCVEISDELKLINQQWNQCINNNCSKRTPQKVTFCDDVKIKSITTWNNRGHWEDYYRDRMRFQERIEKTESILRPILDSDHRLKVFNKLNQNNSE